MPIKSKEKNLREDLGSSALQLHRHTLGVSRDRRLSQTKVLDLSKEQSKERPLTEAITRASRGDHSNYNRIARNILGLFVQRTSFFSHILVAGVGLTMLASTVWSAGASQAFSERGDVQLSRDAIPVTVAMVASAGGLSVPQAPAPEPKAELATAETGFLKAATAPATERKESAQPFTYTVKGGDTVSSIAEAHNITAETILWANNLRGTALRPGQQLTLLPVSGVLYEARGGETLDSIAATYKGEVAEIVAANEVDPESALPAGARIVIPGGERPAAAAPASRPSGTGTLFRAVATQRAVSNSFPWGWCTWWVAAKRQIPWSGNAGQWYGAARAMGYQVGKAPAAGAVYVSWENPYYGHVGYVEAVHADGSYTISEMNYVGFGVVNRRTITPGTTSLIGFIY